MDVGVRGQIVASRLGLQFPNACFEFRHPLVLLGVGPHQMGADEESENEAGEEPDGSENEEADDAQGRRNDDDERERVRGIRRSFDVSTGRI